MENGKTLGEILTIPINSEKICGEPFGVSYYLLQLIALYGCFDSFMSCNLSALIPEDSYYIQNGQGGNYSTLSDNEQFAER